MRFRPLINVAFTSVALLGSGCCALGMGRRSTGWDFEFQGLAYNFDGRGNRVFSPANDEASAEQVSGASEAERAVVSEFPFGGDMALVVFYRHAGGPIRHPYVLVGESGGERLEAWLFHRDNTHPGGTAKAFASTAPAGRATFAGAVRMRGTMRLELEDETVHRMTLSLISDAPIPVSPPSRFAKTEDAERFEQPPEPSLPQPAIIDGTFTRHWFSHCQLELL